MLTSLSLRRPCLRVGQAQLAPSIARLLLKLYPDYNRGSLPIPGVPRAASRKLPLPDNSILYFVLSCNSTLHDRAYPRTPSQSGKSLSHHGSPLSLHQWKILVALSISRYSRIASLFPPYGVGSILLILQGGQSADGLASLQKKFKALLHVLYFASQCSKFIAYL